MTNDALDILLTVSLWAAAIGVATPLIFGTLGELLCERAGVLNLGIEGIMTAGAFAGWFTVYAGYPLWIGVFVAAIVGAGFGLLLAVLVAPLALPQHVTGIGVTLLAMSLSYYSYYVALPDVTSSPQIEAFQSMHIPGLSDLPVVGEVLFRQTPLTYLAFVFVVLMMWFLYRTPAGLAVRMAGESPTAVEAQGIDVLRVRMAAVAAGSALMGIGGSFLALSAFNSFFIDMINGRGWICIALVVFGSWKPWKCVIGALLFGLFDAYQLRLQQVTGGLVPYQLFLMMPYVLSILALLLVARRVTYPQALTVPYRRGQR
jgi:general nucleoside transport system permease protein